jgi:peptide/nickel transport system substrate-binding protein
MPFAYPAPSSIPDKEQVTAGIPGTGPYMLEEPMTPEGVALVRNPHFSVWSAQAQPDGYVDRIEWTFGVEPDAQVEAVKGGEADVALDVSDSGRLDEILVRFAAQVHTSSQATTFYVAFGTEVPPFDDVEVRRAMNLALDRDRVMQLLGGEEPHSPPASSSRPISRGTSPTVRTR